jgi:hypothetical protein
MARIEVDCERIRGNAAAVVAMCAARGIEVAGVTKSPLGQYHVKRREVGLVSVLLIGPSVRLYHGLRLHRRGGGIGWQGYR